MSVERDNDRTAITDNFGHLRDLAESTLASSGDGRLLRWAVAEIEASRRHTRTSCRPPDAGPDYCAECSERAQEWVEWPCPGMTHRAADEIAYLRTLVEELLDYADAHRMSHQTCAGCADQCFEEWCIVRDEARRALDSGSSGVEA